AITGLSDKGTSSDKSNLYIDALRKKIGNKRSDIF
ncbi:unnamed protein product, partial [marine sediment metagenome]